MAIDLTQHLGPARDESTVSTMAKGLVGSEILRIAAEIRALEAGGRRTCNLTVGDFKPKEFPIPARLATLIEEALVAGETNYPPSDGVLPLRQAVQKVYEQRLGLKYPIEGIVIAGGARPIIYGAYRACVDEGETVVYPVPSWNNNHYCHMVGAKGVPVVTNVENGFMPTVEQLAPHLPGARMLAICSPLNPTGTMITPEALKEISQLVVDENKRRALTKARPLILLYDQIYWALAFGGNRHVTPIELVPEVAPYTVFVDGISKCYAATGVRVGWGVGPPSIISRMRDVLGHVGAWAPKAEQVATAKFMEEGAVVDAFVDDMRAKVNARLDVLFKGLDAMGKAGLPVQVIAPQGAIYLSVRFDLIGKAGLATNDEIRKFLLEKAAFAIVPFQAFGLKEDTGWFRMSVGAVSVGEIQEAIPRVEAALRLVAG